MRKTKFKAKFTQLRWLHNDVCVISVLLRAKMERSDLSVTK